MRNSAPGMSPAKIAMATQVTIAPIAGTGSMKNVMGTSSATAMVAVRPGIEPTNSPKQAAMKMAASVSMRNTSSAASRIASIAYHATGIRRPHGSGTLSRL